MSKTHAQPYFFGIISIFLLHTTPISSLASTSSFQIHPFRDYIITTSKLFHPRSSDGLHLPQQSKDNLLIGKVVGIGEEKKYRDGKVESMKVKREEYVAYLSSEVAKFQVDGNTHDIIQENKIIFKCSSFDPTVMDINCLNDHILVEVLPSSDHTTSVGRSELMLPNYHKNRFSLGLVVKISSESYYVDDIKVDISQGARILIANDSEQHPIFLDGRSYRLIHPKDILAYL